MIKFNDNNIYVGYIKQLLKSFNLPRCQVYNEELKDVYDNSTLYIKDHSFYRGNKLIDSYKLGDKLVNITDNLKVVSNIYDEETHRYLGDYLRFIRDYTGLDLMQMYNCFTNESPVNLDVSYSFPYKDDPTKYEEVSLNSADKNYQIFMIPIKYNKVYTIGLDCPSAVTLFTCNYENKDLLDTTDSYSVTTVSGTLFNKPFLFKAPKATTARMLKLEPTLKLMLRIPFDCKSSIVVLEGDYRRGCDLFVKQKEFTSKSCLACTYNGETPFSYYEEYDEEGEPVKDGEVGHTNYFISRPQLFYLNTGEKYLLADRLLEYLSRAVIDCNEDIYYNVRLVQRELSRTEFTYRYRPTVTDERGAVIHLKYKPVQVGKWDDEMRYSIYDYISKSSDTPNKYKIVNTYFDMLGYYDKDVEATLYHSGDTDDKKFEV